jgi:proline racemase
VKTIDAEVAGEPVRLIIDGGPSVPGRTMADKLTWARKHADGLRRMLMLEPRGHAGMHGAILTEPVSPTSHAGILSMHAAGFPAVSGEGVIGALTIALEHKLIEGVEDEVLIDTPIGLLRARPHLATTREIELTGVPAFVQSAGLPIRIGARALAVDIAFGGEMYAIADSEAVGIPIDLANTTALIRAAREIQKAAKPAAVHGTIFTGAAHGADVRSATVLDGGVLRRSPGVTGTAALMAVFNAMGLLGEGQRFTHEGVLGSTIRGTVAGRPYEDDAGIIPVIEAAASITGFHEFVNG